MKLDELIEELKKQNNGEVVVEINGRTDHDIKKVYVDGSGTICIAIELDEDYKNFFHETK